MAEESHFPWQETGFMPFTTVAMVVDVPPGQARQITLGDRTIALFNVDGTFYAIDDSCTHVGGPLSEGTVSNLEVECPWHGARFNLATGANLCPPAGSGVSCYKVQVVGDEVQIDL
jgi:nitrite reductase/ring-hydroxylating ferredoxin subunit